MASSNQEYEPHQLYESGIAAEILQMHKLVTDSFQFLPEIMFNSQNFIKNCSKWTKQKDIKSIIANLIKHAFSPISLVEEHSIINMIKEIREYNILRNTNNSLMFFENLTQVFVIAQKVFSIIQKSNINLSMIFIPQLTQLFFDTLSSLSSIVGLFEVSTETMNNFKTFFSILVIYHSINNIKDFKSNFPTCNNFFVNFNCYNESIHFLFSRISNFVKDGLEHVCKEYNQRIAYLDQSERHKLKLYPNKSNENNFLEHPHIISALIPLKNLVRQIYLIPLLDPTLFNSQLVLNAYKSALNLMPNLHLIGKIFLDIPQLLRSSSSFASNNSIQQILSSISEPKFLIDKSSFEYLKALAKKYSNVLREFPLILILNISYILQYIRFNFDIITIMLSKNSKDKSLFDHLPIVFKYITDIGTTIKTSIEKDHNFYASLLYNEYADQFLKSVETNDSDEAGALIQFTNEFKKAFQSGKLESFDSSSYNQLFIQYSFVDLFLCDFTPQSFYISYNILSADFLFRLVFSSNEILSSLFDSSILFSYINEFVNFLKTQEPKLFFDSADGILKLLGFSSPSNQQNNDDQNSETVNVENYAAKIVKLAMDRFDGLMPEINVNYREIPNLINEIKKLSKLKRTQSQEDTSSKNSKSKNSSTVASLGSNQGATLRKTLRKMNTSISKGKMFSSKQNTKHKDNIALELKENNKAPISVQEEVSSVVDIGQFFDCQKVYFFPNMVVYLPSLVEGAIIALIENKSKELLSSEVNKMVLPSEIDKVHSKLFTLINRISSTLLLSRDVFISKMLDSSNKFVISYKNGIIRKVLDEMVSISSNPDIFFAPAHDSFMTSNSTNSMFNPQECQNLVKTIGPVASYILVFSMKLMCMELSFKINNIALAYIDLNLDIQKAKLEELSKLDSNSNVVEFFSSVICLGKYCSILEMFIKALNKVFIQFDCMDYLDYISTFSDRGSTFNISEELNSALPEKESKWHSYNNLSMAVIATMIMFDMSKLSYEPNIGGYFNMFHTFLSGLKYHFHSQEPSDTLQQQDMEAYLCLIAKVCMNSKISNPINSI
ncbi:MAG: hypothetical protein MHPSP_001153, partial [Paramarteilia canceri]